MEHPTSCLAGGDRTFHLNFLRKRETGHSSSLGYGNKFSKVLYSSVLPYYSWKHSESMQGVHHGGVFNLEFSPDGSLLVAACEKRSFLMFDALSHKQIHAVENAHRDCVNCVRFLDSRTFVTCSDDSTVALWDARNLRSRIRTLYGHSNWVKNIEYSQNDGLLVTSGFDGSIYTWDINSYTEDGYMYERVFHTNGLMRTRLTPDASKMIICTTGGYLMIIHDLNLRTLSQDLHGFKPNMYRLMQQSQTTIPSASHFTSLFSKKRKRNRIEFVSDFPSHNDAEVVSSLQVHPQGWCALSRNISHEELSEWTCVHDIQDRDEEDSLTDNDDAPAALRGDVEDILEDDASTDRTGFRGFPNPNYNSDSESDGDSDSVWESHNRRTSSTLHTPSSRGVNRVGSDASSSSDSDVGNDRAASRPAPQQTSRGRFHALLETTRFSSTTSRLLNDSSPLFQERVSSYVSSSLSSRRSANRSAGLGGGAAASSEQRRTGNTRRLRISTDGHVQISDDDSSGEPASNVRVIESQGRNGASIVSLSQRSSTRMRNRFSRASSSSLSGALFPVVRSSSSYRRLSVPRRNPAASQGTSSQGEQVAGTQPPPAPPTQSSPPESPSATPAATASTPAAPASATAPDTLAPAAPTTGQGGNPSRSVETANAAAAVGAARQAQVGIQGNSPFPQNMELNVASADVWEALVVIQEARARRQHARGPGIRNPDRRELISRFLRRLQDLSESPRQQDNADASSRDVANNSSTSSVSPASVSSVLSTASTSSSSSPNLNSSRRFLRVQRSNTRNASRQAQAPAAIALGHFLRNPTPATTRTLVMIAPHEGGAQNIHLRVSPNSFSYQSQQLRMRRNHKIHQNIPRLSHYIEEPNVGKGFIKELCFSSDGRVMCSPFSYGIRLLAFTPDCQEISTSFPREPPVKLYEVSSTMCHEDYVVSSKFSPTHCLLVSGCLKGKIVWHQPVL